MLQNCLNASNLIARDKCLASALDYSATSPAIAIACAVAVAALFAHLAAKYL